MRSSSKALPYVALLSLIVACAGASNDPEQGVVAWSDPTEPFPAPPFGEPGIVGDGGPGTDDARANDDPLPRSPLRDAAGPPTARWFVDPIDAVGSGLDIHEVELTLENGVFAMRVSTPGTPRTAPLRSDRVEIYLDTRRAGGFDARVVLDGARATAFRFERWDELESMWVERTPRSFSATFGRGFVFQVDAREAGISGALDFAILSIDGLTSDVSDRAPDGAFAERWTYRPSVQ